MINNLQMLGCYAQTELAHGSNAAGLETTATFDKTTDEFIIHTPSIRAYKFWPGSLGRVSTHAVVMAILIIDGQKYGVQAFLVPIRSREDHRAFPGVDVGDIGTKLGYNTVDNGYLAFDKYRVPRLSLLSRFVSVSKEGEFELLGDPRLLYQIMVMTRTMIMFGSSFALQRSTSIAVRYAACRRQFKNEAGTKRERKLLDY
jgi:acyl-CoA oxidase